jgi:hypothetical protein
MQRWNFNVTVPFADWLLGTTYRGPVPVRGEMPSDAAPVG